MTDSTRTSTCPQCGTPYPIGAVAGMCPHCLLEGGSLDDATLQTVSTGTAGSGRVPGYQVADQLGRGGMGVVFRARQESLERDVAVKVLAYGSMDPGQAQRFAREATVLARLEHPNIVPIHEMGVDGEGQMFYTMKLVRGRTLQSVLTDLREGSAATVKAFPMAALLGIFRKVCDAVAFAHSRRVMHRDLKPDNIMIGEFGEVLVMDWGLAKMLPAGKGNGPPGSGMPTEAPGWLEEPPPAGGAGAGSSGLSGTLEGAVLGTPQYMSPEQAMGRIDGLDERSDIYSLGGLLYAILTLRAPVDGTTVHEVLGNVRNGRITPPSHRTEGPRAAGPVVAPALSHLAGGRVPAALSLVAMKALRTLPHERYASVAELAAEVDAYTRGFATRAENAGTLRQIRLLMQRHKAVTASLVALFCISSGFILKLVASEGKATRSAATATANEQRANDQAEQTRRALATSQIAVAEAAFRSADLPAMIRALDSVPANLRDQRWDYLSAKRDASLGDLDLPGFRQIAAMAAVPGQPGQFVLANATGLIGLVDVRHGTVLRRIQTDFEGSLVLGISPDGQRLAVTAPQAPVLQLFHLAEGRPGQTLPAPGSGVRGLAFSPDSLRLAVTDHGEAGKTEPRLFLMDAGQGTIIWQHPGLYDNTIFSQDGRRLFLGSSASRQFLMLDMEQGNVLSQAGDYVHCMALSHDGQSLAVGLYSGVVVIIDGATGTEKRRVRLHQGGVSFVQWTAGDHLLTIGTEGGFELGRHVLRLWETSSFSVKGTFFGLQDSGTPPPAGFNVRSGHLLTLGTTPRLWLVPVDLEAARFTTTDAEQGWATCFLSNTVLLGRATYAFMRYDVTRPGQPSPLPPATEHGYVMAAPFHADGRLALARRIGEGPHSIRLFDTLTEPMTQLLDIPMPDWTMRMDFDAAGNRLLALSSAHGGFFFDARTGEKQLHLPFKLERAVFAGAPRHFVAIVPKKRLAGEAEDELTQFDSTTGQPLKSVRYSLRLDELVASPDRQLIAIGGAEQVLRVLDAATLEERHHFRVHDAAITALAFHPVRPVIATASSDGSVKLWNYQTAQLQRTFLGFDGTPVMLAFSPDGRLLSVEGQEHRARLFDLEEAALSAPPPPAPPPPLRRVGQEWQDLIADLTDDEIMDAGQGWRRVGGVLHSARRGRAILALPGDVTGISYHLRLRLRQTSPVEVLHLLLPVGSRMVGFDLDGAGFDGFWSGLVSVGGHWGRNLPGSLLGKQIKDAEPHDLDVKVQLRGDEATLSFTLDHRPFYEWSGPVADLDSIPFWPGPPGRLALGSMSGDWDVLEAKVIRMEP